MITRWILKARLNRLKKIKIAGESRYFVRLMSSTCANGVGAMVCLSNTATASNCLVVAGEDTRILF